MSAKRHIILLGFKHVGKSVLGRALAEKLNRPFVDLDQAIEALYLAQTQQALNCREIMQQRSADFFAALEHQTLQQLLQQTPAVIALGGGTPLAPANQALLRTQYCVHITAPRDIVFQRIMATGVPAFFPKDKSPADAFAQLWQERDPVYCALASATVDNSETPETALADLLLVIPAKAGIQK